MQRNVFGMWPAIGIASVLLAFSASASAPALVPLLSGCSGGGTQAPDAGPVLSAVLEPIPAPPGLLAELVLPLPEATWKEARLAVSGPALFLPQSLGGVMTSVLGLPITVAGEFDANIPMIGAMIEAPDRPRPLAALGVHVKVGERLVDQVTKGESALFVARVDPVTSITLLEPKKTSKGPAVIGVLGNYLLVGREAVDLLAAGPYIVRTLSKSAAATAAKADITIDVPESALGGPITKAIERLRDSLKGTSAAGVPALPLEQLVTKLFEITPDLTRARVTVDIGDVRTSADAREITKSSVLLRFEGIPKPGGGPASSALREMTVGDAAPLRRLPAGTLIGLVDRESAASRARASASAGSYAEILARAIGPKLAKDDREAIESALRSLSDARGDWLAAGLSFGSTGPVAYVHAAASDQEKLETALRELLGLATRGSIKAWLKDEKLEVKTRKTVIEDVPGDVHRVTIARVGAEEKAGGKEKGKGDKGVGEKGAKTTPQADDVTRTAPGASGSTATLQIPSSIDLFYLVRKDRLFAAAGYGAKEGLTDLLGVAGFGLGAAGTGLIVGAAPGAASTDKETFASVPEIKAALDSLGSDVSFAIVIDPLRLVASRAGKPGAAPGAPVMIALGRNAGSGGSPEALWLRVDIAVAAIQELVKHRGAL